MSQKPGIGAAQIAAMLAWLRQRGDQMAALLAELIGIPTENPPGKNYRACARICGNVFEILWQGSRLLATELRSDATVLDCHSGLQPGLVYPRDA